MGGRGANSNKKQYIRFGDVPKKWQKHKLVNNDE